MRPSLRQVLFRSVGLDLNFAGGVFSLNTTRSASPAAIPGWSFSRTDTNCTATALDLAGNVIQFPSRTNLLERSQEFDNAYWTKNNATVSADQTASPDGTVNADKIQEDTVNGVHGVSRLVTLGAGAVTFSCFVKAAERNFANIGMTDTATGDCNAVVNLTTGDVVGGSAGGSWTARSVVVTAAANGFWRVSVAGTKGGSALVSPYVRTALDASTTSFAGTTGSGVFAWGAQLELGSTATAYIPTTTAAVTVVLPRITNRGILVEEARTNLLLRSNELDNASWTLTNTTISANAATAPDGTTTADKIVATVANAQHRVDQTAVNSAGTACFSVFLKAAEYGFATIRIGANGGIVDLSNGSVSGVSVSYTMTATALANGWYRCVLTGAAALNDTVRINAQNATGFALSFAGDGTSGILAWGAQLELGAFATSPIITTGAAGTRGADVAIVTGLALPSDYSLSATAVPNIISGDRTMASLTTGSSANRTPLFIRGSDAFIMLQVDVAGANQFYNGGAFATVDTRTRAASRIKAGNTRMAGNGTLSSAAGTGTIINPTTLCIGSDGSGTTNPLNGYVERVQVLPFAATDAQLQTLSAP